MCSGVGLDFHLKSEFNANTHQGTTVCKVYIALGWTFTSCYKNQSLNLAMLTRHDEDIVMYLTHVRRAAKGNKASHLRMSMKTE